MFQLSRVARWAVPSCLSLSLLGVAAAAGKTQLSEASQAICNAPLGYQVITSNDLKLPASAIWQNKQQILLPTGALSSASIWRLLSSPQGSLKIETGQVASGFEQALTLQAASPQLLNLPALTDAKLRKLHTTQLVLVQEDAQGRVQSAMRIQSAKALDDLFAPAALTQTLGVQLTAGKNTGGKKAAAHKGAELSLWAPTARAVSVCIYPNALAAAVAHTPLKLDESSGVWRTQSALAKPGTYYRYAVEVFVPGMGWVLNHVNDPYAVSLSANSLRSYVADLSATQLKPAG